MSKQDVIEVEGIVKEALPNADVPGRDPRRAYDPGSPLRQAAHEFHPHPSLGDKVTLEMSPYDLTKGRITWRSK